MAAVEDMVPRHGQSQGINEVTCKNQHRSLACDEIFFQGGSTWRIIAVSKWLITMVIVSPFMIGLFMPYNCGLCSYDHRDDLPSTG